MSTGDHSEQHCLHQHGHRETTGQAAICADRFEQKMSGTGAGRYGWRGWGRWVWGLCLRNRVAIAVAWLIWLIWRSGSQPRRLAYPCQQAAMANLGVLAVLVVPAWARHRRARQGRQALSTIELATGSVALGFVLFLLVSAGVAVYSNYGDNYTPGNPALVSWPRLTAEDLAEPGYDLSPRVFEPNGDESVVAINRNDAVTYGTLPYGPATNTAYELVWQTVADLHLGPGDNPLRDLVADVNGDGQIKVVIKPNWVEYYTVRPGGVGDAEGRSPAYTHPAMARPLVDMAIAAGATQVLIGDSSGSPSNSQVNNMGYPELCAALAAMYPGKVVGTPVNFQDYRKFTWVTLGSASAYVGSGYQSGHLYKANHTYSSSYFNATDAHGTAGPGVANCLGVYALTDYLLDADVIVDLPKMKVHYHNPNTLALKNWVGTTMLSTFNNTTGAGSCRVAHYVKSPTSYQQAFGNDILWRELVDLHRAYLYWKRGSGMQSTQQRRYLCVLDAIVCGETDLWYNGGPTHWRANTVVAGVDPVAVDAVGSRVQRYKFDRAPIVNNANTVSDWPIGTCDPGKLRVVSGTGTTIDTAFGHLSVFDDNFNAGLTWPDWNATVLDDLAPPVVHNAAVLNLGGGVWQVSADISDGHVAFYYYGDDGNGAPRVVRLGRSGDTYSATVAGGGGGLIVVQDEYFNTARVSVAHAADLDPDGDVDADDVAVFRACFSGADVVREDSLTCRRCDLDGDGDVDQGDFGVVQRCYGGSGVWAAAGCAE